MSGYKTEITEPEKEQIIKDFLPFIKYTAYRLGKRLPPQLTVNDLISSGVVGLLDSLQRYETGRVKLSTFVEHRIRGAMLDELRSQDWVPRSVKSKINAIKKAHQKLEQELGRLPLDEEIAASVSITLDEYYKIMQDAHAAITLSLEDFGSSIYDEHDLHAMERIADPSARTPFEILEDTALKESLARHIGSLPEKEKIVLSLYYWDELTMKEIGKVMKLSEGRVCQLHNQALVRLKAKLASAPSPVKELA
ncbi:MAG: FliA/WhiG family RNA polymerase sigma factor [Nitrospirota bacterium]